MPKVVSSTELKKNTREVIDWARAARFARLRQEAAENSVLNRLTEEEAMALVEQIRQELYDEGQEAG
jgi:hypothetical protein